TGLGRHDAAVWVLEDLTALRQAEAARHDSECRLRASEEKCRSLEMELQRVQRLKLVGQVAGGVVHDFNNFLTVVLSRAALAGGGLAPGHRVQSDLHEVMDAAEQAASLAKQLLTISKPVPASLHRIELNHLTRRTLQLLRSTLGPAVSVELRLCDANLWVQA